MLARSLTRIATLGVWVVVAAAAVFWGLKLFVRPSPVPPQATTASAAQALRGDLTRLLGAAAEPEEITAPVVAAASRFQLVGVVAPRSPKAAGEGLALIAIDGKPAKAYRVGATVDGDLVLQRVRARGADLGARGAPAAAVALDVAALPPAATGIPGQAAGLPPGGARGLPNLAGRPGQLRQPAEAGEALHGESDDGGGADEVAPQPARPGLESR